MQYIKLFTHSAYLNYYIPYTIAFLQLVKVIDFYI